MNISSNVSAFSMGNVNSLYSTQKAVSSSSASTDETSAISYASNNVDTVEISEEGLQKSQQMKGKEGPPPPPPKGGGKGDMSVEEESTEETYELDLLEQAMLTETTTTEENDTASTFIAMSNVLN